jgi:lysozyme
VNIDRELLKRELTRDEGRRTRAYRDTVGKLTAGVGRNLVDVEFTDEEVDLMLETDIDRCVRDLATFPWFVELDSVRQRAVVNMRFNLGPNRFREFRGFMGAMIRRDYEAAAAHLLNSKAASQTGQRYVRLARMIRSGMSGPV